MHPVDPTSFIAFLQPWSLFPVDMPLLCNLAEYFANWIFEVYSFRERARDAAFRHEGKGKFLITVEDGENMLLGYHKHPVMFRVGAIGLPQD